MTRIHWESVHARLRASESALQEALSASPQRVEAAYRERAIRLANLSAQRGPVSPGTPAVIFWLGEERYAIDLKELAEVMPCADCTPVPGTPAQFLGVMNVHGELRSVLDLSVVLGVPRRDSSGSGFVLMLSHRWQGIGLRVDSVEDLREIRLEEMTPANQGKFVKGLISGTLLLLDTEKMLAEVISQEESLNA
jgi:purine-binding chemotaxis protein CheW